MLILPAIDIYEGQAVRLLHGDYQKKQVYSDQPLEVAKKMKLQGTKALHLVDLQGAESGTAINRELICQIKKETDLFTEVGGGIRDEQMIAYYLDQGIDRVILGSIAVTDHAFLERCVTKYKEKIAVSVDLYEGKVAIHGWKEYADDADSFCSYLQDIGIRTIICTDISRDGALKGSNLDLYQELSRKYDLQLIASGGVSSIEDVKALREMDIYGAIIGKAYYTGAIDLKEALEAAL